MIGVALPFWTMLAPSLYSNFAGSGPEYLGAFLPLTIPGPAGAGPPALSLITLASERSTPLNSLSGAPK